MRQRAEELRNADAFEPASGAVSIGVAVANAKATRRRTRRRCLVVGGLLAVLAALSLLIPDSVGVTELYAPAEVLEAYRAWWGINVAPLYDPHATGAQAHQLEAAFAAVNGTRIMGRLGQTILVIVSGMLLAVSGMLFQTSFRNPLAAPSMLGAADGVTIGYLVFALMGYTSIAEAPLLYCGVAYGAGALAIGLVLLMSRYVNGQKRFNVFDMLLIGTVLAQLLGAITTFYSNYFVDEVTFVAFYDMQQAMDTEYQPVTYLSIAIVAIVTLVPTWAMRFRLNLIAFPDEEGRFLGADSGRLRFASLILGSVMVIGSIVAVGQVAVISLVVPYLSRMLFGAETRRQLVGNIFLGALLLLICEDLSSFIMVEAVPMPVGTLASLVVMPVFVWLLALQRRSWE